MKKTLTINLNNSVFHIDDDAYELLQSYLEEVSRHLQNEKDKEDIMFDIEARIAEIFNERMDKNKNVVTFPDVETVITLMGKPSQFTDTEDDDEEETKENNNTKSINKEQTTSDRKSKKLYRDGSNRLLGGVSSGLATYFNMDTALVRILFVVLTFLTSASFILVYLILWIIIPKANTTAQKLEMRGEEVNIETIKNKAASNKEGSENDNFQNSTSSNGSKIGDILRVILKVILVALGAIIAVTGILIIAALLVGLIIAMFEPSTLTELDPDFFSYYNIESFDKIILLIISLLLIIGCPIFALIYWGVNVNSKNKKATSNTPLWISLVLWFIGIIMFAVTGSQTAIKMKNYLANKNSTHISWNYSNEYQEIAEERNLFDDFHAIDTKGNIKIKLYQQQNQSIKIIYESEEDINFDIHSGNDSTSTSTNKNIRTEVVDGILKIYNTHHEQNHQQVTVEIGVDSLTYISAEGAASIKSETPFNFSNLKINAEGASKIDLDIIMAQKLDFYLAGASKIDLSGNADTLNIKADGASKVDTENLKAKIVDIELNGASKADVYASDSFTGVANGISRIDIEGQPKNRKVKNSKGSRIVFDD